MTAPARSDGILVVGGQSHDLDFVRLELLTRLARHPQLRVHADADYELGAALDRAGFLVSYTCNLVPSEAAGERLRAFVARGGRWLALHATNSLLDWTPAGVASRHRRDAFFETLGSAFVAHPPIGTYTIENLRPDHPLTRGIEPFAIEDELYLSELFGAPEVLLATRFSGRAPGFAVEDFTSDDSLRPVMYLNRVGDGAVLYLTPGHARGHYDAPHRTPFYPHVERGAWTSAAFRELVDRALRWAARLDPELEAA